MDGKTSRSIWVYVKGSGFDFRHSLLVSIPSLVDTDHEDLTKDQQHWEKHCRHQNDKELSLTKIINLEDS